jgi:hypothetical protein
MRTSATYWPRQPLSVSGRCVVQIALGVGNAALRRSATHLSQQGNARRRPNSPDSWSCARTRELGDLGQCKVGAPAISPSRSACKLKADVHRAETAIWLHCVVVIAISKIVTEVRDYRKHVDTGLRPHSPFAFRYKGLNMQVYGRRCTPPSTTGHSIAQCRPEANSV